MVKLYTNDWCIDNIKTILFDKDGTFINSEPYWGKIVELRVGATIDYYNMNENAFEDLCLALGYDFNKKILLKKAPISIYSREEVIEIFIKKLEEYNINAEVKIIEKIFNEVHELFLSNIFDYVEIIDGVKNFFEELYNKGVQMAVVTSDTKKNAEVVIQKFGLEKYFSLVIGKDNSTQQKSTGEPALIAIEKLRANPVTTISIGDAPMDYQMALNSNLKGSILVATGQLEKQDLEKYTKTVVNSLKEVIVE